MFDLEVNKRGGVASSVAAAQDPSGPTVVAIGWEGSLMAEYPDRQVPTAWVAHDGQSWTPTEVDYPITGAGARMFDVTNWESGFVAVGNVFGADGSEVGVWVAPPEGRPWTRRHAPALKPQGMGEQFSGFAVATSQKGIVVGGFRGAWFSKSGEGWALIRGEFSSMTVRDVATDGVHFVAVGNGEDGESLESAVRVSTDGLYWTKVRSESFRREGMDLEMAAIAKTSRGWVALGTERPITPVAPSNTVRSTLAGWFSPDAFQWQRTLSLSEAAYDSLPKALVPTETGVLVLGSMISEKPDLRPVAWCLAGDGRLRYGPVPLESPVDAPWQPVAATIVTDSIAMVGTRGSESTQGNVLPFVATIGTQGDSQKLPCT